MIRLYHKMWPGFSNPGRALRKTQKSRLCKVYSADVTPDSIAEFMLLNSEFPHSVRFSIGAIQTPLAG